MDVQTTGWPPICTDAGRLQGIEQMACKAGLLYLLEEESQGATP